MILCIIANFLISNTGYYALLSYSCLALTFFMVKNLKLLILVDSNPNDYQTNMHGNKRRIYLLLFISFLQPLFMWWLTWYHI
jgi:protein transport protein YIF1